MDTRARAVKLRLAVALGCTVMAGIVAPVVHWAIAQPQAPAPNSATNAPANPAPSTGTPSATPAVDPAMVEMLELGLVRALNDTHPDVRLAAVQGCQFLAPNARVVRAVLREPLTRNMVLGEQWELAALAEAQAETVAAFGESAVPACIDLLADPDVGNAAMARLTAMPSAAVPALSQTLAGTPDAEMRYLCAWVLGKIGPAAAPAAPAIFTALADADARVVDMAAWAAGNIGETATTAVPRIVPALAKLMDAESPDVRRSAILALANVAPTHAEIAVRLPVLVEETFVAGERAAIEFLLRAVGDLPAPSAALVAPILVSHWQLSLDRDRQAAIGAALAAMKAGAVPALTNALLRGSREWWTRVLGVLRQVGPEAKAAVPLLDRILDSPTPIAAIDVLGEIGAVTDRLVACLGFADDAIREAATRAISKAVANGANIAEFLPKIIEWARDESNADRRASALFALVHADAPADIFASALASESPRVREFGARGLVARPADFVAALADIVRVVATDGGDDVRATATRWGVVTAIATAGESAISPLLAPMIDLPTPTSIASLLLLRPAIGGTKNLSPSDAESIAERLAEHFSGMVGESAEIAGEVLAVLRELGPHAAMALPTIAGLLDANDGEVRRAAVDTLAAVGTLANEFAPKLLAWVAVDGVDDGAFDAETLRSAAVMALAKIAPNSLSAIAANVLPLWLAGAERDALAVLDAARRGFGVAADRVISRELAATLADTSADADARFAVADIFADCPMDVTAALPALIAALRDADAEIATVALELVASAGDGAGGAVLAVAEHLAADDAGLREDAARTLYAIGPASIAAQPALVQALGDESPRVVVAVLRTLAAIGPAANADLPAVVKLATDGADGGVRAAAVRAVAELAERPADHADLFLAALRASDAGIRQSAIAAMGKIADSDSLKFLGMALSDPATDNRVAAARELGRLGLLALPLAPNLVLVVHDRSASGAHLVRLQAVQSMVALLRALR